MVSLIDLSSDDSVASALDRARGREAPFFFPKILPGTDKQMVMLYPGDAGYDAGDITSEGARHRSIWLDGVISYENTR